MLIYHISSKVFKHITVMNYFTIKISHNFISNFFKKGEEHMKQYYSVIRL